MRFPNRTLSKTTHVNSVLDAKLTGQINALDAKLTGQINAIKEEIRGVDGRVTQIYGFLIVLIVLIALIAIAVGLPQ